MSKSFTIKKWNSVTGLTLLHASCLCRRWKGEEITKDWKGERHRVLCTLSQDTLNAVSDQNLLWTQTATETVPQSWSPTWLGHVCALSCSSLSLLHNRIWPRGQKFIPPSRSPTYTIFYKVRLYDTNSLLLSLLFHFYMENTIITRKVFTAFLPHLKIFFLIWNIGSMEKVQLQPEIHISSHIIPQPGTALHWPVIPERTNQFS